METWAAKKRSVDFYAFVTSLGKPYKGCGSISFHFEALHALHLLQLAARSHADLNLHQEDDEEQPHGASKLKTMARKGKEWLKGLGKGGKGKEKERRNLPEISPSVESLVGEAELGEARAVTVTPVTAPSKPALVSPQQAAAPAIYEGGEGTPARASGKRTARALLEGYE